MTFGFGRVENSEKRLVTTIFSFSHNILKVLFFSVVTKGGREGRKEAGKEGRKEGRKEGKEEGRKEGRRKKWRSGRQTHRHCTIITLKARKERKKEGRGIQGLKE